MPSITTDVVVIGAGAAGLMTAIEAGRRGRRVRVLEHSEKPGKKILISGGGHCNFTNMHAEPDNYLSANPHFCKSALARYSPWDFVALVEQHGIAYHEKELGQLFCDGSARQIVQMLLDECRDAGVQIDVDVEVEGVTHGAEGFALATSLGHVQAERLVVATGGLSIPKMGATAFGYELARQFGHRVAPTRAGLVPLALGEKELPRYADLSGVGLPATVTAACGQAFTGGTLFTHRGLSGPAVLQISSYWQQGEPVWVDFLPGVDLPARLAQEQANRPDADLRTVLSELLPKRVAQRLCELTFETRTLRRYNDTELRAAAERVQHWEFRPIGTEGYRTAEVTLGGVDTDGLSSSTLGSKLAPGLHFVGEVVDVTGHLGGYNFQWAWASGHAAGQVV